MVGESNNGESEFIMELETVDKCLSLIFSTEHGLLNTIFFLFIDGST